MKELVPLLEQLAAKLGTSVETIWAVLLKQAPISGALNLFLTLCLLVLSIATFRFVNKKTTTAEWCDEGAVLGWIGCVIILGIIGILILCTFENMVTAFVNPQYWALQKIMSVLHPK